MQKRILLTLAFVALNYSIFAFHAFSGQYGIRAISTNKDTVKQYEALEITVLIAVGYENPYAAEEVDLTANITMPDGRIVAVPAFYSGYNSLWKIRYTPTKTGKFSYNIRLKSSPNVYSSELKRFEVLPGAKDGFLRKGTDNPFYPVYDSGRPFFGVGHNVAWITNNDVSAYEKYFALLKENGCNLTRIWINSPWTFWIENDKVCSYNSGDAEKIDRVITLAQNYGIHLILVLDTYGALMEEEGFWNENFWNKNPYNKINGGPCERAWDFFTDRDAKRYYKNRLRYIIARWSYSPYVMAFELFNETDAPADWVKEVSGYMDSINPHGQFVTISLGYPWGNNFDESAIWALDGIDIIQRHIYGNATHDLIEHLASTNIELSKKYNKPLIVGEFGMDSRNNDAQLDTAGEAVAFHQSLWASALSRSFGSSMNWWWAEYIKGKNLYPHYKAFRNFINSVKWNSPRIDFVKTTPIKIIRNETAPFYSNITVGTNDIWGDTTYKEFTVYNNGDISGGLVNRYLHGKAKKEFKIEPLFHVDYPADGKFILHIDMVSQGANLVVTLDGNEVLTRNLPAGPGEGPWKRSLHRKDFNIYQCIYDTDVEIDVPRGKHIIRIFNTGNDWIKIDKITLTNYLDSSFANARVFGLFVGQDMVFWIQNKEYNWKDFRKGLEPSTIKNGTFSVSDPGNADYQVEWWDTFEGKIISSRKSSARNGRLNITIPEFSKDIACKVKRLLN